MGGQNLTGRWAARAIVALALTVAGCGDNHGGGAGQRQAPALIVEQSHDAARTLDVLRLIFVPSSVQVTTLGAPSAVRVFVTASQYFEPALALAEASDFLGVPEVADRDLVALRCEPTDLAALDVRFATWPRVFDTIRDDLGGQYTCPPPPGAPTENAVYCIAAAYTDEPSAVVARPLATALELGAGLLEDPATADVVRVRYGIYPGFSGLGLAVRGSADNRPMDAAEVLEAVVAPEYLVRNATLSDGGCRCIRVAPYEGRAMDPLDPRFIRQQGGLGECRAVQRLRFAG